MSVQSDDMQGIDRVVDLSHGTEKKIVISYTRDFLLSLSDLDVCKRLPGGFDESLLSEFEDTSQDRFRISGSLSSQNFRRNEYGSSPPTRGDGSNYSRGIHTRWDSHSSGRSDRDSDSQSDREPDSGRRYGNQSRRPWQSTEHDGLLGSGSFPRPSGFAAGISTPKFRANDHYQLNRSNEPYHPPRPYKAVPHLHRETKDSFNDETFGSSEVASEDRAEEERKRREEFELMRKEQHKAFQEKKFNPEKRKDGFDITELLDESKDVNRVKSSNSDEKIMLLSVSSSNADKSSLITSANVSRPPVPPGFTGSKSSSQSLLPEVGNELLTIGSISRIGESSKKEEKLPSEQIDLSKQFGSPNITNFGDNKTENIQNLSSDLDFEGRTISLDSPIHKSSKISESFQALPSVEKLEFGTKDMTGNKVVGEPGPARSTSILDKLFGSSLTLNDGDSTSFIEHDDGKTDETWSSHSAQSSKFAQWFPEEEKKPDNDLSNVSSGKLNDFLSLFVGGEKGGSEALDVKANKQNPLSIPFQNSEVGDRLVSSDFMPSNVDKDEQMHKTDKLEAVSTVQSVLTCEDLEQSILLEATENDSAVSPSLLQWTDDDIKTQKADAIDNHASLHILSLLQKGTGPNDIAAFANQGSGSLDTKQNTEVANNGPTIRNSRGVELKDERNSGKPLTLETLFGTAFMRELQSTGGSASGQRGSVAGVNASVSHGLHFREIDDDILASDVASNISNHGTGMLAANQRQQIASDRVEEHFLGFGPRDRVDSSQLQTELGLKLLGTDSTEIGLREDDSLLAVSGPMNLQNFISARNSTKLDLQSASEAPVDIAGKLAALNSVLRDERTIVRGQEGPPFHHGPYERNESDIHYHNIHRKSSPQLHPSQSNHVGPVLHPLDTHPANINARMKFMNPENIIHHDPSSLQFHGNALQPRFHHPSSGIGGPDPDMHSSMLHQIPRPGNYSPAHLLPGFPRGAPHPSNNMMGYMQNNEMQGFPFGQRQPNFGGVGIPPPASEVSNGTNHPGAFQYIEMESRSKPKQILPFGASGQSRGMFGHELDMGFGFR